MRSGVAHALLHATRQRHLGGEPLMIGGPHLPESAVVAPRRRLAVKQLSDAEKSKASERLRAYAEAKAQTKIELINAARAAENNEWPQYLWPDGTEDAWFHRKSVDSDFIEKRGGFPHDVVILALTDPDWETKESVAAWLRQELKLLREAEVKPGAAPVRRGKTLSRIEISEIAVELLQCLGGEILLCLFQELLDVDRHRKSLADGFFQLDRAAEIEAMAQLQGVSLGVRLLAKRMSVSPSTVTRWKRSRFFWDRVKLNKDCWGSALRADYFEQIKAAVPQATEAECFRRALQMYVESIPQRRSALPATQPVKKQRHHIPASRRASKLRRSAARPKS